MKLDNFTKPGWYYNSGKAGVGPLDYAEQQDLNVAQHAIIKYTTRAGRKPGNPALKDYKQALFYLNYLIEQEQRKQYGLPPDKRIGPADRRKCFGDGMRRDGRKGRRTSDIVGYWERPLCSEDTE